MTDRVFIQAGQRNGRTFDNEGEFLAALDEERAVFTERNGVYFEVVRDGEGVRYIAMETKPEGL